MKLPDHCPACNLQMYSDQQVIYGTSTTWAMWIQRAEKDWHDDEPARVETEIMECSKCHALFRFYWTLTKITRLEEMSLGEL